MCVPVDWLVSLGANADTVAWGWDFPPFPGAEACSTLASPLNYHLGHFHTLAVVVLP